ncbi:protein NLRC3-like [Cynoglossus semilaevis]|uniref:protein NLRC3-like n=1 Tax=Cynoglossus semilaevis TaxID=244447 RepID=UPI000D62C93B|nr:protein NLRC3-like [Cynoglossus semilaevis]
MDSDAEVDRILRRRGEDYDEENNWKRPPSSYGSMRSESECEEEKQGEGDGNKNAAAMLPGSTANGQTRFEPIGFGSYTTTTYHPPSGALFIHTSSADIEHFSEDDDEEMERELIATSPEPPEPVELEDTTQTDENSQPGRLHPEQDLPHIFKSIQNCLGKLDPHMELHHFKQWYLHLDKSIPPEQLLDEDLLFLVDRMIQVLGLGQALITTISTLECLKKNTLAVELREECKRAEICYQLKEDLKRRHRAIFEGVPRAGHCKPFDQIYVEPQISTCRYGGVDPSHEFRSPSCPQVLAPDSFISLNNLFRLQKSDGSAVRTVLTSGIPGMGMTVSVCKFCLDWAEMRANKDLQFVIKLSFRKFWNLRKGHLHSLEMSIMELIQYFHPACRNMSYLEEEDCKYLIIMDSFDCYQAPLDWKNAPVITDHHTKAHPDDLIVNIIRGTLLRNAHVWILGRGAAVSQIPSNLIDVATEIQGFSDEMKDDYFTRRLVSTALAVKIIEHYKRLPTLNILARQPFICWMIAQVFTHSFSCEDYGENPPRLTPFYIHIMISWSPQDQHQLKMMGLMALKMLEKKTTVFSEEDLQLYDLRTTEVTVLSGLCTELTASDSDNRRTFCFIHLTIQEFMAAFYVFFMFHPEGKNVLGSGLFKFKFNSKELVQCALERTLNSPLGDYDMFLRFLCGLLSPECHFDLLSGFYFPRHTPKVSGLDNVKQLLEHKIQTAPADRVENLKECLRELTQRDV